MKFATLPFLLLATATATAAEVSLVKTLGNRYHEGKERTALPLVVWHGLGDSFDSEGIQSVSTSYLSLYPSSSTHIIALSPSSSSDRSATFLGHVPTQISSVCSQLQQDPALSQGFNALGFSQGGQFLRGLIQSCPGLKPRTLVTMGSQHNGISKFTVDCSMQWWCGLLYRNRWGSWVQGNVVPAQYLNEGGELVADWLLEVNGGRETGTESMIKTEEMKKWGAGAWGEDEKKRLVFKQRLSALERFVMVMWKHDETVVPKESAWFYDGVNGTVPLRERKLYKEDWLGLKQLDESGRLEMVEVDGGHMQIPEGMLEEIFRVYMGPDGKKGEWNGTITGKSERLVYDGESGGKGEETYTAEEL
ncbi:Alpha/Beta hydrolase protein [Pyronema omphalodes]|nr:Alpha/Beta hydrolase protein [Pyronema omphalodes]